LDAESIGRKIRAFASNPGVFTTIRGEQIKINEAHITVGDYQPGELTNEGVVGTSAGAVQLVLVTPAGKRTMQASDWLNGFKLKPGERFE
jgi:methionyl-tRNA formyltransferase